MALALGLLRSFHNFFEQQKFFSKSGIRDFWRVRDSGAEGLVLIEAILKAGIKTICMQIKIAPGKT